MPDTDAAPGAEAPPPHPYDEVAPDNGPRRCRYCGHGRNHIRHTGSAGDPAPGGGR